MPFKFFSPYYEPQQVDPLALKQQFEEVSFSLLTLEKQLEKMPHEIINHLKQSNAYTKHHSKYVRNHLQILLDKTLPKKKYSNPILLHNDLKACIKAYKSESLPYELCQMAPTMAEESFVGRHIEAIKNSNILGAALEQTLTPYLEELKVMDLLHQDLTQQLNALKDQDPIMLENELHKALKRIAKEAPSTLRAIDTLCNELIQQKVTTSLELEKRIKDYKTLSDRLFSPSRDFLNQIRNVIDAHEKNLASLAPVHVQFDATEAWRQLINPQAEEEEKEAFLMSS